MRNSLVDRASVERLLLLVGALRSGLIDALASEGPASAAQVAAAAGADARASRILLEALAEEGIADRTQTANDGSRYSLTPAGRAHLVDPGPLLERSGLIHQANKLRGWLELPEVIRTGKPAPRHPDQRALTALVCAMGERDPQILDEIVDLCLAYTGKIETMVDVGGAVGHLARQFARRGVKATLFDREEVLPTARQFLGEEAPNVTMLGGDYTASLPAGPFDLVYFGNVYHIYGRETNARVTRQAFATTAEGGTIAIQDYVWGLSDRAAMFAVNMLRSTDGGEVWTEADYRGWLSEAGFTSVQVADVESAGTQLIFGRRPSR
jgi:O-methyltransferase domain/Dimerisation domain